MKTYQLLSNLNLNLIDWEMKSSSIRPTLGYPSAKHPHQTDKIYFVGKSKSHG